jgi:hypothetical protein
VVEGMRDSELYQPGDAVEYLAEPLFDVIIQTGVIGVVTRVQDGCTRDSRGPASTVFRCKVGQAEPSPIEE